MRLFGKIACIIAMIGGIQMGCSTSKSVDNQSVNSAEQTAAAMLCDTPENFVACMRAGDIERTWIQFDKAVSDKITKYQYQKTLKQVFDALGEYKSYVRTGYAEIDGNKIYDVVEKYKNGTFVMRLSYTPEGKIDGFFVKNESEAFPNDAPIAERTNIQSDDKALRDADAPASTDKYKESD